MALNILNRVYGFPAFREPQAAIINDILVNRRDCFKLSIVVDPLREDLSLVSMATGRGKSLTYQIPALASGKVAIIVSPLISLMNDQVMALKELGVSAVALSSTNHNYTMDDVLKARYSLVYITPEKIGHSQDFLAVLSFLATRNLISHVAIDECHCISQWGGSFRPDYKKLHVLRETLGQSIPIIGCTASANKKTRDDIITELGLVSPSVYVTTFDRPNLTYTVLDQAYVSICKAFDLIGLPNKQAAVLQPTPATIIYCQTRDDTERIAQLLRERGYLAASYHAQQNTTSSITLSPTMELNGDTIPLLGREDVHQMFQRDRLSIIVATVAFGMGIDKPDIRRVMHWGAPQSIEAYYQESGRAGRDGLPSSCILFYSLARDFSSRIGFLTQHMNDAEKKRVIDNLQCIKGYCREIKCRRFYLLSYFEEDAPPCCQACDNCTQSVTFVPSSPVDVTIDALLVIRAVRLLGGKTGKGKIAKFLLGHKIDKHLDHKLFGAGKCKSKSYWTTLCDVLISHSPYLVETQMQTVAGVHSSAVGVSEDAVNLVISVSMGIESCRVMLPGHIAAKLVQKQKSSVRAEPMNANDVLSPVENDLLGTLRAIRATESQLQNIPAYYVFADSVLREMAKRRPAAMTDLRSISGVGDKKLSQYGALFFDAINEFCQRHSLDRNVGAGGGKVEEGGRVMPSHMQSVTSVPSSPVDVTIDAVLVIRAVRLLGGKTGKGEIVQFLLGHKIDKHLDHNLFGAGKYKSKSYWTTLCDVLISHTPYLVETQMQTVAGFHYSAVGVSEDAANLVISVSMGIESCRVMLPGHIAAMLVQKQKPTLSVRAEPMNANDVLSPIENDLFGILRAIRATTSRLQNIPAYYVFADSVLREMAKRRPAAMTDLRSISGVGDKKLSQYGAMFFDAINEFCHRHSLDRNVGEGGGKVEEGGRVMPSHMASSTELGPSIRTTVTLFKEGKGVNDIASVRKYAVSTILGHLMEAAMVDKGLLTDEDWTRLNYPDGPTESRIMEAACMLGAECYKLRALMDKLGADLCTFDAIKMVKVRRVESFGRKRTHGE